MYYVFAQRQQSGQAQSTFLACQQARTTATPHFQRKAAPSDWRVTCQTMLGNSRFTLGQAIFPTLPTPSTRRGEILGDQDTSTLARRLPWRTPAKSRPTKRSSNRRGHHPALDSLPDSPGLPTADRFRRLTLPAGRALTPRNQPPPSPAFTLWAWALWERAVAFGAINISRFQKLPAFA